MPIALWRRRLHTRLVRARPTAPFRALGLERFSGDRWRATDADPQFLFSASSGRLVLYVRTDRSGGLSPRFYFDWGEGFSQEESAPLDGCDEALVTLDFSGCEDLRALRFDPFDGLGELDMRFGLGDKGETLAQEAEAELGALRRARIVRAHIAVADHAPARDDRMIGLSRAPRTPHEHFLRVCALAERELAGQFESAPATPLISLISPLYNTPPAYLDDLLASFRKQPPGWAELVMSDDGSTSARTLAWLEAHSREPGLTILIGRANRGIALASNAGVAAARGAWIGFIDHDDALSPHAIGVLALAIQDNPNARFLYTDEMIADARLHALDFFDKPAFDDVLLSGVNYINHLSLYRRDLMAEVGGFREGYDGSQDYDLLLRATAKLARDEIRHVPYPAYIWRRDGRSYSVKFLDKATTNARRALAKAYASNGREVAVDPANLPDLHRLRLDLVAPRPKVSIVVPNKNAPDLIGEVVEGLFRRTDYPDFELIVVDNGSTDPATLALYETMSGREDFTLLMEEAPFNFSRQVNKGMALAKGDAILLLNNDVEVLSPDWLGEMVGCLAYPQIGVVGARLLYPARTLQHAGVVVGLGGLAGHWYQHRPADFAGPMGRLAVRSITSAVTAACMLISRACLEATGPYDETGFAIAYNDVDFCLRARNAGFRTLYTPFATLLHHESATRGRDERGPNRARFLRDQALLIERHGTEDYIDPTMSPWHARESSEPYRIVLDKLPPAR